MENNKVLKVFVKFKKDIKKVNDLDELEEVRKDFTGKDSELNVILRGMKDAKPEEKQKVGKEANEVRSKIIHEINELHQKLMKAKLHKQLESENIDVSLPIQKLRFGTKHPLNLVIEEISSIFEEIGFMMVSGPEVEQDLYNFQKLNLPIGHPARDMQDTFYLSHDEVLRTHATNMTARMLTELAKDEGNHLAAVSFGNVYRRDDDDVTHSHQFMQIDGFAVGQNLSFANLKWVLTYLMQRLFGNEIKLRLRPSYFPFTEPSVEVDISCFKCNGKGCPICKYTAWIEVLGAGMINDNVFKENGFDPTKIRGFAFGVGIERIAMLKFGVNNIRSFYEDDVKFLNQFKFYGTSLKGGN